MHLPSLQELILNDNGQMESLFDGDNSTHHDSVHCDTLQSDTAPPFPPPLPSLHSLTVSSCPRISRLPAFLSCSPSLLHLKLHGLSDLTLLPFHNPSNADVTGVALTGTDEVTGAVVTTTAAVTSPGFVPGVDVAQGSAGAAAATAAGLRVFGESRTSCAAEGEGGGGAVAAVETAQTARKGGGVSRRATETITASKVSAEGDTARAFGPRRSRGGGGGSGEDGEAEIGEAISATSPLSPIIAVDEFFSLPSLALPPAPPGRALESLVFMLAEAGKAEDEEEWGEEAEDWGEINWGEEGEWNAGGEGQGQREGRGIEVFWASDVRSVRGGDETPPPAPYSAPSSPSPPSPPTSASSAPLPLPPPHLVLSHLRSASLAPCVLLPAAPALPGPGEGEEGVGGGADGRSARAEREAQGSGAAQFMLLVHMRPGTAGNIPLLMLHVYMRPGTAVNIPLDRTQSALIYVLEGVAMFGPRGEAVFQNEGHSLLFPAAPSGASSVTSDAVSEMDKETDSTVGGAAGVGARGDEEDWIRVESHSWGGVEFVLVAGQS
ncbi:unnamed protein product [Closterium sp. NIES-65]|nr:unnamed protein product [Closterium sp. NIES-65]